VALRLAAQRRCGYIDTEGYLQITDRIKDVIKSGGEWISSLDLENLLSQHPAVLESAAIASRMRSGRAAAAVRGAEARA